MRTHLALSRRDFLRAAGVASSALAFKPNVFAADAPAKRLPVAIQMCSVFPSAKADIAATLKALAAGYEGVELAMRFGGFYGLKASELRKRPDDAGLRCTGATFNGKDLDGDALKTAADNFTALGGKYLLQADLAVPKDQVKSRDAWLRAAERFTRIEERLAPLGLHAGLHNHTEEWAKTDSGDSGWEIIFANTPASFVQEIDTCHCPEGGGDPLAMVRKHPVRTRIIHLKEFPRNHAPVNEPPDDPFQAGKKLNRFGEGKVPWSDLFAACESVGGTEWYIMETWMGSKPIEGRDLEFAKSMIDFMRRHERAKPAGR